MIRMPTTRSIVLLLIICSCRAHSDDLNVENTSVLDDITEVTEGGIPTKCTANENEEEIITTTPKTSNESEPGYISKLKCKEYSKYAEDMSLSPTLGFQLMRLNTLECPFDVRALIVGGKLTAPHEFPHMALIGAKKTVISDETKWICGGSLISEHFVLTAAHCFTIFPNDTYVVRLGINNKTEETPSLQQLIVSEVYSHPKYKPSESYHDIGLMKLAGSVTLNTEVRPACLYTENNIPQVKFIVTGWGKREFADVDGGSDPLLKTSLEFYNSSYCNKKYAKRVVERWSKVPSGIIDDFMICAGSSVEVRDTCEGDSGGPLQIYHNENDGIKCMYDIVGVTSFGQTCAQTVNRPGVYTRVSTYIDWIESRVWPKEDSVN